MRKVSEYEEHAIECRRMARKVQDANHKDQLEDMAKAWETLADKRRRQLLRHQESD
jgi:hypothetical protein